MRGIGARAVALLAGLVFAGACEPTPFAVVSGHPGKRGIDGGPDDAGQPPPPLPSGLVTLTIVIDGAGRVFSPPWFDCSSTCSVRVPAEDLFEVHAEGSPGFGLVSWAGVCTDASGCRLTLDDDARLDAMFRPMVR
jgi:hypothetical protein